MYRPGQFPPSSAECGDLPYAYIVAQGAKPMAQGKKKTKRKTEFVLYVLRFSMTPTTKSEDCNKVYSGGTGIRSNFERFVVFNI
jgi:hypothetical protein